MQFQLNVILFLPLLSAAVIALFLRRSPRAGTAVSVLSAGAVLGVALAAMFSSAPDAVFRGSHELFKLGGFSLNVGCLFDSLSRNMLFVAINARSRFIYGMRQFR